MKNLKSITFVILALFIWNATVKAQEGINEDKETITGIFDSFDGENYIFNYITDDDDLDVILFSKISPEVLKKYDLNNENYVGENFKIIFRLETEIAFDIDGEELEYFIRTLTDLKLLD